MPSFRLLSLVLSLPLAACGGGTSSPTPTPPTITACTLPPAAPNALTASSVLPTSLRLNWSAVTPDHCNLSFSISIDAAVLARDLAQSTFVLTGLQPQHTYTLTVTATDAAGTSAASAPLTVTTSAAGTIFNGIALTGKLIWHSYTSYGFAGVQAWMANFDTGSIQEITPTRVDGAMNFHFSPDGKMTVFMGSDHDQLTQSGTSAWDIWVATVAETGLTNLTRLTNGHADGSRNEDPKFSSDGTQLIFKRNLNSIAAIAVSQFAVNGIDQNPTISTLLSSASEVSMPYFIIGSNADFLYADSASHAIRSSVGGVLTTLYATGTHAYYPIGLDGMHFYFTAGVGTDLIYRGDLFGNPATPAMFIPPDSTSEFADPFPLSGEWLAFASTAPGGLGAYDIWLGDFAGGSAFNLDNWIRGANHINSDLGATFHGSISSQ